MRGSGRSRTVLRKGLDQARRCFQAAARNEAESEGWQAIFGKYDDDGSGELDVAEFIVAVRETAKLEVDQCSDAELENLFAILDKDNSGGIDAKELMSLLTVSLELGGETALMGRGTFVACLFELATNWGVKAARTDASMTVAEADAELADKYINFFRSIYSVLKDGGSEPDNSSVSTVSARRLRLRPLVDIFNIISMAPDQKAGGSGGRGAKSHSSLWEFVDSSLEAANVMADRSAAIDDEAV
eukprot:COSAG02_NODE_5419_length_4346_cov_1.821286_2_plen_244_part_00